MSAPSLQDIMVVVQDASDRLKGFEGRLSETVTAEAVKTVARDMLNELLTDPTGELASKLRSMWAANNPHPKLAGSKFAKFGCTPAHVELAYDILSAAKKAQMSSGPSEELTNAFNSISQASFISPELAKERGLKSIDDMWQRYYGSPNFWTMEARQAYEQAIKAMDTAESGYGSQLIGAQYVGDLWMAARRLGRIFPLIDTFEMTAPTTYVPIEADLPEMLFVSENTSPTASAYTTSKAGSNRVQLDAKKFIISMIWSLELEEDSIIPLIDYLMLMAQNSLAHYSDSVVLNGDTTNAGTGNINLDDADPADTKHYLAFDGIRHASLVDVTTNDINQAGAITWNALMNMKGKLIDATNLIDWGHPTNPDDLVYVADPETGDEIGKLTELLTVDKYGPNATVLNGEQGRIARHPLVTSIAMSKTEADGKVSTTAANNTLGQVAAFNRRGFRAGWRRQVKVETFREVARDQNRLFFSLRLAFGRYSATGAASGLECAGTIRNITVATT